jgi:hypothetical protein
MARGELTQNSSQAACLGLTYSTGTSHRKLELTSRLVSRRHNPAQCATMRDNARVGGGGRECVGRAVVIH